METNRKPIEEDFKAAFEAFKSDSLGEMNIFSNRLMSNAIFGNDAKIFLAGFFLKDVATTFELLKTKQSPTAFSTSKSHGFSFIETLQKLLTSLDEEQLWKEFHSFRNAIRKFEMDSFEEKTYSDNPEFTKVAFSWLLSYLKAKRNILFDSNNLLLKGVLNEMNRIFKVHSGALSDTVIISLIEALDRYYDYFRRIFAKPDTRYIDEEIIKNNIFSLIDQIEKIYAEELKLAEADSVLWKLVKGWREFYIQYMELPPLRLAVEKGIVLPEDLKKKISEGITKTLEKEV